MPDLHIAVMVPGVAQEEDVAGGGLKEERAAALLIGQKLLPAARANRRLIVADQDVDLRARDLKGLSHVAHRQAILGHVKVPEALGRNRRGVEHGVAGLQRGVDGKDVAVIGVRMRAKDAVDALEFPGVDHLRIEPEPVDAGSSGLTADAAVIVRCIMRGRAVLIDKENAARIRLEHPGRSAAPPEAYLSLGDLEAFDLLVEVAAPFRKCLLEPNLLGDRMVVVKVPAPEDTPSIRLVRTQAFHLLFHFCCMTTYIKFLFSLLFGRFQLRIHHNTDFSKRKYTNCKIFLIFYRAIFTYIDFIGIFPRCLITQLLSYYVILFSLF